jgi:hypothetical protein
MDRDDARRDVGGVDGERAAEDKPGVITGPDMEELAGAGR